MHPRRRNVMRPAACPIDGAQIDLIGASVRRCAAHDEAAPNGGYLRIAAYQRWLQPVIRFRTRHRAKRRIGVQWWGPGPALWAAQISWLWLASWWLTLVGRCRADLKHALLGEWVRGGDLDGLGHVLAVQDVESQKRAFGVQERSVGRLQLVLPDPDRYRFGVGGESVAGDPCPLPSIVVTH